MRFVEGSAGPPILRRVEEGLTNLPTHDNPFLDYIVTGSFRQTLPLLCA